MSSPSKDVKALARKHTEGAVKTLVGIMNQPKATPAARVAAAQALLDRGWGKAHQPGSITHDVGDNAKAIWEAIAKNNAGADN